MRRDQKTREVGPQSAGREAGHLLPDGRYVIPWPRLVLDRITPTGLYFTGLAQFGASFPDGLGMMFQEYVGSQLSLLQHAEVLPEIVYGKHGERTVDFFLITPEVLVLIEVKAARPIRPTRLGQQLGDEDTQKKVGQAFKQIDRTHDLIQHRHPALSGIPRDLPVRALVVTLEPFHLINTGIYQDLIGSPSVSTLVASAHELEGVVAGLRNSPDIGLRLVEALTPSQGQIPSLRRVLEGLSVLPNPLLDRAWERFSYTWSTAA